MPSLSRGSFGISSRWQDCVVMIKPERLLESRVERCEMGGRGLTMLAVHLGFGTYSSSVPGHSSPVLFIDANAMYSPLCSMIPASHPSLLLFLMPSLQYNMRSPRLQILLCNSLRQPSYDIKDLLIYIPQPTLRISIVRRQPRNIAVVLLARRM